MLRYTKGNCEEYEEKGTYTNNIDEFLNGIISLLYTEEFVDLKIQPGDGTSYVLRVWWDSPILKHLKVRDITNKWEVVMPKFLSPCFLKKHLGTVNAWSAALICDLGNRICGHSDQRFYNWDEAVPTYVLDDVIPEGWEEGFDSKECQE